MCICHAWPVFDKLQNGYNRVLCVIAALQPPYQGVAVTNLHRNAPSRGVVVEPLRPPEPEEVCGGPSSLMGDQASEGQDAALLDVPLVQALYPDTRGYG